MAERVAELRDLADEGRDHAQYLAQQGDHKGAAEWLRWADTMYRGTEPVIDPGTGELEKLHRMREWVDARIERMVRELRAEEVSWQRIGWALGMSAEGARKRWTRKP